MQLNIYIAHLQDIYLEAFSALCYTTLDVITNEYLGQLYLILEVGEVIHSYKLGESQAATSQPTHVKPTKGFLITVDRWIFWVSGPSCADRVERRRRRQVAMPTSSPPSLVEDDARPIAFNDHGLV